MHWEATTDYGCDSRAPGSARSWVVGRLRAGLGPRVRAELYDDAALVVSELVTNSVQAGSQTARITLRVDDMCLRIAVADDAPGRPAVVTDPSPDSEGGRGLNIVVGLAVRSGVMRLGRGKEVWADLLLDR